MPRPGLGQLQGSQTWVVNLRTVARRPPSAHSRWKLHDDHCPPAALRAATPTHAALQPLYSASASANVLWELALLQWHYHPHVAQKAKSVAQRSGAGARPRVRGCGWWLHSQCRVLVAATVARGRDDPFLRCQDMMHLHSDRSSPPADGASNIS